MKIDSNYMPPVLVSVFNWNTKSLTLIVVAIFSLLFQGCEEQNASNHPQTADQILTNAAIYTVDAERSWAEAVAILDRTIIAVGSDKEISVFRGTDTVVHDLAGQMVMPGVIDTHIHALGPGLDSERCILPGTFDNPDETDMVKALEACNERFAGDNILYGYRFTTSAIAKEKPPRQFLDNIVPDRPVILYDESGHNNWLNTKAMALTEITDKTPDPEGGVIHRDENGVATGYLQSNASQYIDHLSQPGPTLEAQVKALNWSMQELARKGVTAAMEAITPTEMLPIWKTVLATDTLVAPHMHICHWIGDNTFPVPNAADVQAAWNAQGFPDDVRQCAKIYGDNVLEAGTAGLLENYQGRDHSGRMNFTQEEFDEIVADFDAAGIQLKTHSIGDKTTRTILNSYAKVIDKRGRNPLRHHVAHITVVHPDDIDRFHTLDVPAEVIGSVSALIPYVKRSYYDSLGDERFHERIHPIGAIVRAGGKVNASSDWGAGILDPMRSIQTVVTRRDPNNPNVPAAGPQNSVDVATAIELHTIHGAYLLGRETEIGSIEVGKRADLIVIDQNLFKGTSNQIRDTKVLYTLIGGKIAWADPSFYAE